MNLLDGGHRMFSLSQLGLTESLPLTKTLARVAVALIFCGLMINEFFIAHFLSSDGSLELSTLSGTRLLQAVLILGGISLLVRKRSALVALFCVLQILNLFVFRNQILSRVAEERPYADERYQELRGALPSAGHVGYITDETLFEASGSRRLYYQTQYALAPVVVEAGPTQELVVGNFQKFDPHSIAENLILVRDFGNGLILFRKRPE